MKIDVTSVEKKEFGLLLPSQGNLKFIEMVNNILTKVNNEEYDFTNEEIIFLKDMIQLLDSKNMLSLSSLSLIKKILNIEIEEQ